jgi:calcium-dependent protein kinase
VKSTEQPLSVKKPKPEKVTPVFDDEKKEEVKKVKLKQKLPEGMMALGIDKTYEFVDGDHNIKGNVMELFDKKRVLGQGASCEVAHVSRKQDGAEFAVKIMKREDKWNPLLFRQEYELLTQLDHPNIVKFCDSYMDGNYFYVCTELCKGGELFDKIKEMKKFAEVEAAEIVQTIIDAISHCHSKDIVHRDLKPENIVFRTRAQKDLVIIDFGDAKRIDVDADYEDFVGTAFYLAPESIRPRKGWELKKSDMWTIGVITFVLLTGRPPFYGRDNKEILRKILRANLKWPRSSKLSRTAKEFVLSLINKNTKARFSSEQALNHKWLRGGAGTTDLGITLIQSISNYSEASKLKKVLVRMLGNEMTLDDHNMLKEQFDQIDLDSDGQINLEDLTNFLHKQGGTRSDAEMKASQIIKQVDQHNNGVISIDEFKNAKLSRTIGNDKALLKKQFERIDEDRNGYITQEELSKLFNWSLTPELIKNMIKEIDDNNDGQISYDEFVAAMKHGALEKALSGRKHITGEMTAKIRKQLIEEDAGLDV